MLFIKNRFKVFIAGSTTEVAEERSIINDAITEWNSSQEISKGSRAIEYKPYSFKSFPNIIDPMTGNYKYNEFIRDECDLIVFIIAGDVQDKTKEEFDVAYGSLHGQRQAPRILVFCKKGIQQTDNVSHIRNKLYQDEKYWINYDNPKVLSFLIKEQLTIIPPYQKPRKKIALSMKVLSGILALALLTGIGLFHYYRRLTKQIESNITYIKNHPGLSGTVKKNETLDLLNSYYFPKRDSLINVVKNL